MRRDFHEDFHYDDYGDKELLLWNNWPKKANGALFPVGAITEDSDICKPHFAYKTWA